MPRKPTSVKLDHKEKLTQRGINIIKKKKTMETSNGNPANHTENNS
jgi:hypothetical protein